MLSLNDVSAWIEVDGKELEQYGIEQDLSQNRVTCWVATHADKRFSVVFRDDATYREHSLTSSLELDGSSIGGKVLQPPIMTRHNYLAGNRTVVHDHQVISATSSRPFMFSKLELTDEDEYLNGSSIHLGEIRVNIYRAQVLESFVHPPALSVSGHGKVHERSKKAVTHCVSYGQETETPRRYACRVRHLDDMMPLATFIFRYRDPSLLQANGIIPRPPPTKKEAAVFERVLDLTADDDVKPDPIGDEIEIIDNTTRKRAAHLPTKRLNSSLESEAQPVKRVKREKESVRIGEVIDLT